MLLSIKRSSLIAIHLARRGEQKYVSFDSDAYLMKNNYGYVVMQIIPNIDFSFFNCESSPLARVLTKIIKAWIVGCDKKKEKNCTLEKNVKVRAKRPRKKCYKFSIVLGLSVNGD